jgi:hypothetical protein
MKHSLYLVLVLAIAVVGCSSTNDSTDAVASLETRT